MSIITDFSKVFQQGKTTIPSQIRKNLGIKDGDEVAWGEDEEGKIIFSKKVKLKKPFGRYQFTDGKK